MYQSKNTQSYRTTTMKPTIISNNNIFPNSNPLLNSSKNENLSSNIGLTIINPENWIFRGEIQQNHKDTQVKNPNYTTNNHLIERFDDIYLVMKPFLIWGQFIGLLPFQFFANKLDTLEFRWMNFWAIYMIFVTVSLFANVVVSILGILNQTSATATELAYSFGFPMFYFNGFFIFQHFFRKSREFLQLFKSWSYLMSQTSLELDKKLSKFIHISASVIFISAVLENAAFHVKLLFDLEPITNSTNNNTIVSNVNQKTFLEEFYFKTHDPWKIVPYHFLTSLLLFFTNKWALYAWNYIDLLIAIFSRAFAYKLESLRKGNKWDTYERDYKIIVQLFHEFEKFLSPLIFYSYLINTFSLCLHLHLSLTPSKNKTIVESLYSNWSYIHLILRFFIVTLSAASLNKEFQRVYSHIQSCPKDLFDNNMERLERLASQSYAFTGLGCFSISYPFILSVINVLFTFEIVLLQTSTSTIGPASPPKH